MKKKSDLHSPIASQVERTYPSFGPGTIESVIWTEKLYRDIAEDFLQQQKEWGKSDRNQKQIFHSPPVQNLYKYKSLDDPHRHERIPIIFKERTLWAATIASLNDPLEAAFVIQKREEDRVEAEAIKMMVHSKWWGCICFSFDPVCPQMWAHYAACHSGFCIQYRRLDSALLCSGLTQPLAYRRAMPELKLSSVNEPIFFTKSENWEYEREWRLMYPNAGGYVAPGLLIPSGVLFGVRTSEESKAFLRECAGNVRFGQVVLSEEPYRLKIKWEEREDG